MKRKPKLVTEKRWAVRPGRPNGLTFILPKWWTAAERRFYYSDRDLVRVTLTYPAPKEAL